MLFYVNNESFSHALKPESSSSYLISFLELSVGLLIYLYSESDNIWAVKNGYGFGKNYINLSNDHITDKISLILVDFHIDFVR